MDNFKRVLVKKSLSTPEMLERLRHWLPEKAGLSLTSFADFICKKCSFLDIKGNPRTQSCMSALKALDAQGHISLQEFLNYKPGTTTKPHSPNCLEEPIPMPVGVPARVDEIQNLHLRKVTDRQGLLIWNTLLQKEHYLGARMAPGRRVCYLVYSEHGLLGAVGFTFAANRLKAREEWIGWTDDVRQQNLDRVINMGRLLIRVQCQNLASKIISLSLKTVKNDYLQVYGFTPYLAETFVDSEKFDGTCYKAAGWEEIGLTCGRGRNDRNNTAQLSIKHIFMRPLIDDFREKLGVPVQAQLPEWAAAGPLKLTDNIQGNSWARCEFSSCELGHRDRNERLIYSAEHIAMAPHFSANHALKGDSAGITGWYRLIESPHKKVNFASILGGHRESTYRRMLPQNIILAVQDSTSLNFTSKPQTQGIGHLCKNQTNVESRGLILHSTLAVTPDGLMLGIMNATCHARQPKKEQSDTMPVEERESYHWVEHAQHTNEVAAYMPGTHVINVCDRGADIAYLIHECAALPHCDLLVRAKSDRHIPGNKTRLFQYMAEQNIAGTLQIIVPRRSERPKLSGKKSAIEKREKRKATLEISFCRVPINPAPEMKGANPVEVSAVYAVEKNPPAGQKAVEWRLLTTLSITSFNDAVQCIQFYSKRWVIEEFHRVLKSGCRVEYLAHKDVTRIQRALAIYMVVSWRLMVLLKLGREMPNLPSGIVFNDLELEVLADAFKKKRTTHHSLQRNSINS